MLTVQIIAVAGVVLLAVAGLIALRLAGHRARGYEGPELTPYDLAVLAGGPSRAADTALASLTAGGVVRARRDGRLTQVSGQAGPPPRSVEAEILTLLKGEGGGVPVWEIRNKVSRGPAVAEVVTRLRELGLIDAPGSGRADPTHPNRAGKVAVAHYRLRHRESRSLPPRPGDHLDGGELNDLGVALHGLRQMREGRLAAILSMGGPPSSPAPRHRASRSGASAGSYGASDTGSGSGCGASDAGSGGGGGGGGS